MSKDAILDRTLKNDVYETPTAKNSSAIGENLAVGMRLYRFSRTRQGQAACGGGCVSGEPSNPPARNLSAIVVRCELLPELLWSQVVQRVGWTLFIEESYVIVDFLFNAGIARHMEVLEQFSLDPTVDCFLCCVVCRRTGTRHGTDYIVHRQQLVEVLGGMSVVPSAYSGTSSLVLADLLAR